jgi:hypothetical protein
MPPSLYAGHCATLVTRHAKERVLAPVLRHAADLHLQVCHALSALASAARFPEHALVLRPDGPTGAEPVKGLADWEALLATFERLRQKAVTGLVFVESDLRAHCHPTRMQMIERAGHDLAERLITRCPSCGSPGFGHSEVVRGLPCADCGTPTDMASGDRHACVGCAYTEDRVRLGATVGDPARCPVCNP